MFGFISAVVLVAAAIIMGCCIYTGAMLVDKTTDFEEEIVRF